MPNHETFKSKQEPVEKPLAAKDTHEQAPEAMTDNTKDEHLPQAPKPEKHEPHERAEKKAEHTPGPVADIIGEIHHAPKKGIVFLRDIVGKHDPDSLKDRTRTKDEAKPYFGAVQKEFEGNEEVVILGQKELEEFGLGKETGRGKAGEYEMVMEAIAKKYPDQIVVLDYEPKLEDILVRPFDKLGEQLKTVMNYKGTASTAWLTKWFSHENKEGEPEMPSSHEVAEHFHETLHALGAFSGGKLGGRSMSLGLDAENPLALAFVMYCLYRQFDTTALNETLKHFSRPDKRTVFVELHGHHPPKVSFGNGRVVEGKRLEH